MSTEEPSGELDGGEPEVSAEVAYVWPASVVDSIATDDSAVLARIEVDSPSPILSAVEGLGIAIGRKIDALQAAIDREGRAEANREKVVDRLHAELQEYKNDLLRSLLRPVFIDLIQLHDDIGKVVATQASGEDSGRLIDLLRGFQQGVEDILYRQGVETFEADGDAFDPRRQRAFATRPTDDPALNKQVAARLRKGFRSGEKVIRPEIVSVYAVQA